MKIQVFLLFTILFINVSQLLAGKYYCGGGIFNRNDGKKLCWKHCSGFRIVAYDWCYTSNKPNATLGDEPTECESNPEVCNHTWPCVSTCYAVP